MNIMVQKPFSFLFLIYSIIKTNCVLKEKKLILLFRI